MVFQGDLRFTHLPYCLYELEDGRFMVVNRRHKPLGITSHEHFVYEEHPSAMYIEGITGELALELDVKRGTVPGYIFLWDGATEAPETKKTTKQYLRRLRKLMTLKMYTDA